MENNNLIHLDNVERIYTVGETQVKALKGISCSIQKGDLLAIMSAGAYGYVMSSNYNVRPRVPEVIVKGNKFEITKKRESFEDLLKGEKVPSFLK